MNYCMNLLFSVISKLMIIIISGIFLFFYYPNLQNSIEMKRSEIKQKISEANEMLNSLNSDGRDKTENSYLINKFSPAENQYSSSLISGKNNGVMNYYSGQPLIDAKLKAEKSLIKKNISDLESEKNSVFIYFGSLSSYIVAFFSVVFTSMIQELTKDFYKALRAVMRKGFSSSTLK